MTRNVHIAVDFGGGSGRVIAGMRTPGGELLLEEVHRFGNRQVQLHSHTYWDFPALYAEMVEGLRKAVAAGMHIMSVGIDTWGVDFGLIDRAGCLLGNPYCYRDNATEPYPAILQRQISTADHYARAGIQIMPINSIYRLMAIADEQPEMLAAAQRLLFMPDLFAYFLTGQMRNEYTIASTSELLIAKTGTWNRTLIEQLHLPQHLFGDIIRAGQPYGNLTPDVMRQIGVDYEVPVVAVGTHDTASAAYAAGSGLNPDGVSYTAFLSSGTWSLLGVRLESPIATEQARMANFSNEGGVDGVLLLTNITGLWILQRLVGQWQRAGEEIDYPTLVAEARLNPCEAVIDVDAPDFVSPADMQEAILSYCRSNGQVEPRNRGELVNIVLRSLAARYARAVEALNAMLPHPVTHINVVGGGSLNSFLNELTALYTGAEVVAGASEATAIGNIMAQEK